MTKLCRECNNPIISKAANAFLCDSCVQIHKENSISLYRKNNKSYNDEYNSQWRAANPEKMKLYSQKQVVRRKSVPKLRVSSSISRGIRYAIGRKKNGCRWEVLVGYTVHDLMNHLESLFLPGMTWENYGEWHIDHVIPQSWFQYENLDDQSFKDCWALENLQPLWAKDNWAKAKKRPSSSL